MEIYYFTYTGFSKKIAENLGKILDIRPKEIKSFKFPYLIWLILSFFPYLGIKATFEPPTSKTVFLCFPKWTFNCPPVTYFLKKLKNYPVENLILFVSYKGWGADHYKKIYTKLSLNVSKNVIIFFIRNKRWIQDFKEALEHLKII